MHIHSYLNASALEDAFWKTVLETAGTLEIHPACALSLRAWITVGVQRMERQQRLAAEDIATAHASLRAFIDLMKREAVILGKADRLDNVTFRVARRRVRREGTLTAFSLWPYWPQYFVVTN
jgi:hypothetical protein